ncbi:hypothetical protein BX257_4778 [Streptomyces sp. 3212.3]|uniref:hypothetical protein n=1 Tax=Streptomyces sp. 3212.3 TaxID=1938846 RepID=UPI000E289B34|nr:hypothetical protein [Streptomyces sp. 3212.3]REE62165.1 hypothetical protein BX257_4778 [Streptomyces sp. 3212.3]
MSTIARPWYEDLEDSVRALGETAREYQLAHTAATTLLAGVEYERRRLHDGKVSLTPRSPWDGRPQAPVTREPHADAVFDLAAVYRDHALKMRELYEHAALLYASGCAWAIRTVQQDANPNGVNFQMGTDHKADPGPLEIKGLVQYVDSQALADAYVRLMECLGAGYIAEDLDGREYLADHEASQLHDALEQAAGTADAAYAYGQLAEAAVTFALVGQRRQHARREVEAASPA